MDEESYDATDSGTDQDPDVHDPEPGLDEEEVAHAKALQVASHELAVLLDPGNLFPLLLKAADQFEDDHGAPDTDGIYCEDPPQVRPGSAVDVMQALLALPDVAHFFLGVKVDLVQRVEALPPGGRAALYSTAATFLLPVSYFQSPLRAPVTSFLNSQLNQAMHSIDPRLSPLSLNISVSQKETRFMVQFDLAEFLRKYTR